MAKLWPSRSSMVVVAERSMMDGTVVPETVTALAKSSSLTVGLMDRLMMPELSTVGRNLSCTPKGRHTGTSVHSRRWTGLARHRNFPPARKLAVSPERATRFGSAKRCNSPLVSSAVTRVSILTPLLTTSARMVPNGAPLRRHMAPTSVPLPVGAQMPAGGRLVDSTGGVDHRWCWWSCRPERSPLAGRLSGKTALSGSYATGARSIDADQLTPSCRPASRETSRKRTFSMTCCGEATIMALITLTAFEPLWLPPCTALVDPRTPWTRPAPD